MTEICGHPIDEYIGMIEKFHGHMAPGLLIGGFMVDLAMKERPEGEFFDVLCETATCLPDAVQILTPCTYGNGWLKVVNVGRFAIAIFEKHTGNGVRVFLDAKKLKQYTEVWDWFMKIKSKQEQDKEMLVAQIIEAGHNILSSYPVRVDKSLVGKGKGGATALCPGCSEAYPLKDGSLCLACQGTQIYHTDHQRG